jgi:hypothetical protein
VHGVPEKAQELFVGSRLKPCLEIAKLAAPTCDDALAAMWDYLDEELDPRTMERIEVHLWLCLGCHDLFAFERRFLHALAFAVPAVDITLLGPRSDGRWPRRTRPRDLGRAGTIVDRCR